MRACRYIDGNKIIPYYVISTLVRPPFPPLLFSHVSSGGRVKSSEETLIGSDFSFSRLYYLLLPSTLLFFILALTLLPSSRARRSISSSDAEKIFPCRRHPSERESPVAWIFALFSSSSISTDRRPFLFQISMSTERTVHDPEIFHRFVSPSFNSPSPPPPSSYC